MKVLFVYRNPKMGISIGKVFKPIEEEMRKYCEVDAITFTGENYSLSNLYRNIITIKKYLKNNPDTIIHITGTEHYLLPFLRKYKTIVTVHDLGFYVRQKKTIRVKLKYPLWIGSLKYADIVACISKKTSDELKQYIKLKEDRMRVVENPVGSSDFFQIENKPFNTDCPVVLQIGTKDNKNLSRVITALDGIKCKFRIIGPLSEVHKVQLKEHNINYSQDQDISDEQILKEYQTCDIVVFASEYEGFGMPIIEGHTAGKAVVTSNIPPMSDISGGASVLVDPFDVESIRNGILEAIKNHEKYEKLGMENVRRFTVPNKTKEYYNLYLELDKE